VKDTALVGIEPTTFRS